MSLNLATESQVNAERGCHLFQNLELKEGAERREIWEKVPYPMDFKIYIFNITNPMEIQKGATPVVQEVGPYCYKWVMWEVQNDEKIADTWGRSR